MSFDEGGVKVNLGYSRRISFYMTHLAVYATTGSGHRSETEPAIVIVLFSRWNTPQLDYRLKSEHNEDITRTSNITHRVYIVALCLVLYMSTCMIQNIKVGYFP